MRLLVFGFVFLFSQSLWADLPPKIQSLIKPEAYERLKKDKEVIVLAKLEDSKSYRFWTSMMVNASPELTHQVLFNYPLYKELIPFIQKSEFDSKSQILEILGGLWSFQVHSFLKFIEKSKRWLKYEVVRGQFTGMKGDIIFETHGESTLVYLDGELSAMSWPPAFIMERGAEVVFTLSGRRMRSHIESLKYPAQDKAKTQPADFPQPRKKL